jgi:hypothetical protein
MARQCSYVTVESKTFAPQNGACTCQCITLQVCDIIYNPVSQFFKGLVAKCFFFASRLPHEKI